MPISLAIGDAGRYPTKMRCLHGIRATPAYLPFPLPGRLAACLAAAMRARPIATMFALVNSSGRRGTQAAYSANVHTRHSSNEAANVTGSRTKPKLAMITSNKVGSIARQERETSTPTLQPQIRQHAVPAGPRQSLRHKGKQDSDLQCGQRFIARFFDYQSCLIACQCSVSLPFKCQTLHPADGHIRCIAWLPKRYMIVFQIFL